MPARNRSGVPGRRRQDRIAAAAERSLDLGAGEHCIEAGVTARRKHGEPVKHTRQRGPIDDLVARTAIPAGDLHRRLRECAGKAEAAVFMAMGRDGEIDKRDLAEFTGDAARRFDVVGDRIADDSRRDLAVRIDERLGPIARPVDFDAHEGAGLGRCAPGQHVLAGAVGGAPRDRIVGRNGRQFGHRQFVGRGGALDLAPLRMRSGTGAHHRRHIKNARRRDGNQPQSAHIRKDAHESGANVL